MVNPALKRWAIFGTLFRDGQLSCGDTCIPKQSLGTRGINREAETRLGWAPVSEMTLCAGKT
jgi:hypothetical protein